MKTVYRILDANLDRAREGLRVIEEWCRFGLENSDLTAKCKDLRQELAIWHTDQLRLARDTANDPGTDLSHKNEETRSDIRSLLRANLGRVQEALRVLEEYSKIDHGAMAIAIKQMRYQVYMLETEIFARSQRHQKLAKSLLYLVTMPTDHLLETVELALQGGLTLVQYRDKEINDRSRVAIAQELCQLCHKYDALFLVNDRVDIALAVGADGVHLGQTDLPVSVARSLLGEDLIIGQSTTSMSELQIALEADVDYIGVGPIYATPTKPGKAAAELDYIDYVANNVAIPWYAIGGIDLENLPQVLKSGATRVAVVRSLMAAQEPKITTKSMLRLLDPIL